MKHHGLLKLSVSQSVALSVGKRTGKTSRSSSLRAKNHRSPIKLPQLVAL